MDGVRNGEHREREELERRTFRRHATGSVFEALFSSVCWAAPEIAVKAFDAGSLIVTLLTMAPGVTQAASIGLGPVMARVGRRRLLRASALLGRTPLLLVYFIRGPWTLLALVALQAISMALVTSSTNSLLRSNYRDESRGRLFAAAQQLGALAAGIFTVSAGIWLDRDPDAVGWIYPIAGISGLVAAFVFAEIDVRRSAGAEEPELLTPREMLRSLTGDADFRRFELAFFIYGLAFMAGITAKPLRMADELDLSYSVLLGARGVFSAAMILWTRAMGRLMDRVGPAGLAARSFALLAGYSVLLLFVQGPVSYLVAEAIFGIAMAGVLVAWNMGPVTLAPTAGAARRYMLVHVALVGVRALVGHPLGGWLCSATGQARGVFVLSAVLFAVAATFMSRLDGDLTRRRGLGVGAGDPRAVR